MYRRFLKRALDLLLSVPGVLCLLPLLVLLWLLLLILNRGHPFYIQSRPGLHDRPFSLIKFRTMTTETDENGQLLPNHLRITATGGFLRKYSLDELPQLINVIKGDMSLVGPRPLLFKYIPLYTERQGKRNQVKPGITGWAQVNGRNAISWSEKLEFDAWYVESCSFGLDAKILWNTLRKVLSTQDINADLNVTMPPFNGHN